MILPLHDRELISYSLIKKCETDDIKQLFSNDISNNYNKILSINSIVSTYKFKKYINCIDFATLVGGLAEKHNHHPEIIIKYDRVIVIWHTWTINDISENDLIMAAKVSKIYNKMISKDKENT